MSKTMKRVSALFLAVLMIVSYMPMMQETAYAAKAKKPGAVKGLKVKKSGKKMIISWKKAKNAKKYSVSIKDNTTKLTATKSTKKKKLTIKGQWSTKYTITVKGVNGKKKGKAAKKTVKIGADPKLTAQLKQAAEDAKVRKELEAKLSDMETKLEKYKAATAAGETAIEEAKALIAAYDALDDATKAALGEDFAKQVEETRAAIETAEEAIEAAKVEDVSDATRLSLASWNPEVKKALNDMIDANKNLNKYVVFDFDNTCSIYDVEEQLAVYQLQTMAFDETVDAAKLEDILKTGIDMSVATVDNDGLATSANNYQDWIDDITAAYQKLLDKGYKPTPAGIEKDSMADDPDWQEFATKMRAMYDVVFATESADVAYPWVLYWFTGMTHQEVYDLAYDSHSFYKEQETSYVTWTAPEVAGAKVTGAHYTWSCGTQVSDNIKELMAALDNNGIDVWVCSASATDPIRAAIDVWGLHDHVTGMMAMTNVYKKDAFINEYDYEKGYAWYPTDDGWEEGNVATKAQTQGKGKVTAIQNVCGPIYQAGPIAGFMDSTGDYNFCTEFKDLQVVCCFNRASRKPKDGGGVIAEVAVYEADTLGYDYAKAQDAGDTLYVLQARDERGLRGFLPQRETIRVTSSGEQAPKLFAGGDNQTQLDYMIANKMTVKDIIDKFAIKFRQDKDDPQPDPLYGFNFDFGFLKTYDGYHSQNGPSEDVIQNSKELSLASWNPEVKFALNDMIAANKDKGKYVVFDFDNTCSIYDVEEQLAVYQLQTMAFDETVDAAKLEDILRTGIDMSVATVDNDGLATSANNYQDWIDDITAAYQKLLDKGYKPTPAGIEKDSMADDPDWQEFATKMRAMYDVVFATESADVAYPWVLYWFTGMTHQEVYDLAYASHSFYKDQPTSYVKWTAPEVAGAKVTGAHYTWSCGTQVSDNIKELMAALDNNGIDVWVCSASATDPIRAAIDVWGLHDHVTGMMAMTNVYEDDAFINAYDYTNGYAWYPTDDGWEEGDVATKAQTQGKGKVTAVQNVCGAKYDGAGPIAGFMDSTGDYNFCTEFEDLEVVCCFNRASRKPKDGGGVIAEVAVYEADTLNYDYAAARAAGDTLYVLQGRDERGLRGFLPQRETIRVTSDGTGSPKLFAGGDNKTQLDYMIANKMSVEDIIDKFAIKWRQDKDDPQPDPLYGFNFDFGFLKKYDGYHSQTGNALDAITALKHEDWNPEVKLALNDMMVAEHDNDQYVVFDFDNTCSIYDVEEQLAVYQLQTMAFDETVDAAKLEDILRTGIDMSVATVDNDGLATSDNNYQDWIDDITAAYQKLLDKGYEPTPAGIEMDSMANDPDWQEFATKMRAMYDVVFATESADVAYPWVLYWFTGMTHKEVYDLAYASHSYYKEQETSYVTWTAPEVAGAKVTGAHYTWSCGTQVSENIQELMAALDENGIDVWVCSASATDPIRAAIDVWGLHDNVTGMMAMTNVYEDDKFINEYDYEKGYAWYPTDDGWEEGDVATKAQTQGKGKVTAVQNVCYPLYNNHGPIAGFMDSTGDYNFCTEFKTLQVVCCFNRASRKPKDGGGVIAETAVYEADTLGYNYAAAQAAGDTLYVLQARDERGLRGFLPQRETIRVTSSGEQAPKLFAGGDNQTQLDYMIANKMTVKDIIDKFAIKFRQDKDDPQPDPLYGFNFDFGFLKTYDGYHSQA